MSKNVVFDSDKCSRCGMCARVCMVDYIRQEGKSLPEGEKSEMCFHCGHCVAVCPKDAIHHPGLGDKVFLPEENHGITKDKMIEFLSVRRSCRFYSDKKVERMLIREIIDTAQGAPSTFNCQDRGFIVIDDPDKIDEFRQVMIKETKKNIGLANFMLSPLMRLVLKKDSVTYFKRMRHDMVITLEKALAGEDAFLHGAPCLVLFTGIGLDIFGKDHALGAMHYFIDIAQAAGLGTCIIGHVTASKKMNSLVGLPPLHKIMGAVTLGFPTIKYRKSISREAALVEYV